jgi:surface antigen
MHFKALIAIPFALVLGLSACTNERQPGTKESIGAVSGAILGGIAGAQFGGGTGQLIATGAGAAIGLLVGAEIGRNLDEVDQMKAQQAQTAAASAPVGETIAWNNPDSGNSGSYTTVRDGQSTSGEYCREFQETVTIDGKTESAYGVACRQPDGSWKIR